MGGQISYERINIMDTNDVWEFLSNLSVGTVVAWITVVCTVIAAICTAAIKLYNLFEKYKKSKDKITEQEKVIAQHNEAFAEIREQLKCIFEALNEQREVNLKQVRHTIVHACEDALEGGELSTNKLQSLEEMYDEYTNVFHGNGYVKTLMTRVRKEVKIIGG